MILFSSNHLYISEYRRIDATLYVSSLNCTIVFEIPNLGTAPCSKSKYRYLDNYPITVFTGNGYKSLACVALIPGVGDFDVYTFRKPYCEIVYGLGWRMLDSSFVGRTDIERSPVKATK